MLILLLTDDEVSAHSGEVLCQRYHSQYVNQSEYECKSLREITCFYL